MKPTTQLEHGDDCEWSCEWSPEHDMPAVYNDTHTQTALAVVLVGTTDTWRLCAECAELPKFKHKLKRVSLVKSSRIATSPTRPITFHGEIREDLDGHRHYQPKPADLEGKTIERFVCDVDNVWSLFFTDGTAVSIETEVHGGLPTMDLCNTCWKDDVAS